MVTKKIIIIGIIGVIVIYLLFAFANVSFNLKECGESATVLCAFLIAFLALFACIINDLNKK